MIGENSPSVKQAIKEVLDELMAMTTEELLTAMDAVDLSKRDYEFLKEIDFGE